MDLIVKQRSSRDSRSVNHKCWNCRWDSTYALSNGSQVVPEVNFYEPKINRIYAHQTSSYNTRETHHSTTCLTLNEQKTEAWTPQYRGSRFKKVSRYFLFFFFYRQFTYKPWLLSAWLNNSISSSFSRSFSCVSFASAHSSKLNVIS